MILRRGENFYSLLILFGKVAAFKRTFLIESWNLESLTYQY